MVELGRRGTKEADMTPGGKKASVMVRTGKDIVLSIVSILWLGMACKARGLYSSFPSQCMTFYCVLEVEQSRISRYSWLLSLIARDSAREP